MAGTIQNAKFNQKSPQKEEAYKSYRRKTPEAYNLHPKNNHKSIKMQNSIQNRRKWKKHRLKINQKSPQKQEASTQNRRKIGCGKKYGWHYIQF